MIDKLSLTIYRQPDIGFLESQGTITEAQRDKIYKNMCVLDRGVVLYRPHKFSEEVNLAIPYTKIDMNPKYFECSTEFFQHLFQIFGCNDLSLDLFNASRIDIYADIEYLSMESILATLTVKRIRGDNFNIYKNTIYGGTNPKIRIYDKTKEIKARLRKGQAITPYERYLIESGKTWIRFEIQIRNPDMTLQDLINNPASLMSYFDRLEFLRLDESEPAGVMQFWYRLINRKCKKEIEYLKKNDLVQIIKAVCLSNILKWLEYREPF